MTAVINPTPDPQSPIAVPALLPGFLQLRRTARNGIKTGIRGLDEALGGLFPGLHILGAKPNIGKTAFALQVCLRAAKALFPSLYLSFDESPTQLAGRAAAVAAGIPQSRLRTEEGLEELEAAAEQCHCDLAPLRLLGGTAEVSGTTAAAALRSLMRTAGVDSGLLVVDFLQVWASRRSSADFRKAVSECVTELQQAVREANIPVLAIAALNRDGYDKPSLSSLRETSDLEFLADSVLLLAENPERQVGSMRRAMDLTVAKNRNGPVGKTIPLVFDGELGRWSEESFF